jgi:hypothetical protein
MIHKVMTAKNVTKNLSKNKIFVSRTQPVNPIKNFSISNVNACPSYPKREELKIDEA